MIKKFTILQEVAKHLFSMQLSATKKGTNAIAGLLVNSEGDVIHEDTNTVLVRLSTGQRHIINPTAHAQQTIMYWYWLNKAKLNLPEPQALTIVTTLDPCLMCASSIIMSGFNVGTISLDNLGGVNYNQNCFQDFHFSPQYHKQLINKFGYYKIQGDQRRNQYQYQAKNVCFRDEIISNDVEKKIEAQFYQKLQQFANEAFRTPLPQQKLLNIKALSYNDELIVSLKNAFPDALSLTLTERVIINEKETIYYEPDQNLKEYLQTLVKETPDAINALAIIDTYGNLLFASADRFDVSPIHTSIVNATIGYSALYFNEMSKASQRNQLSKQSKAYYYLPSLYYCTYVFLNALPGNDAASLQAIGVYTFTKYQPLLEGGFIYINDYQTQATVPLQHVIQNLPPLYKEKHINVTPSLAKIGRRKSKQQKI